MTADAAAAPGCRARALVVLLATLVTLAAACATPTQQPAPTTTASTPAPGAVRLDGAVRTPVTLDPAQLAGMAQTDVTVAYQSAQGTQSHRERGVALASVIPSNALAVDPARKNDLLTFGVLAVGADGYQALVSYGEVSPDFGNRGLLVSLTEDGKPLARPRLVVPGEVKGGRYVSDLVELRVVHAGG